jgi:hypothetical protein
VRKGAEAVKHEKFAQLAAPPTLALGVEDRFGAQLLALFVAGIAAYLSLSQRLFQDGDTAWHVAAGLYMLKAAAVPTTDPFSYTFAGHPWLAHEWLAEVFMAAAFRAFGWAGIALAYAVAAAATIAIIGRELLKRLPARWALCLLLVVCVLLNPHWLARPHLLTWPLLATWTLLLLRARDQQRAPPLAASLIMLIWANIHASYILGLGIAAAFAFEALLSPERRDLPKWAAFVAASVVLACITPHGISGFLYPFQVSGLHLVAVINEWRPTTFKDDKLFLAWTALAWLLIAWRWRQIHPVRILLLAGMTAMALVHARHQMTFVIVASLLLAPLLRAEELPRRPVSALWIAPVVVILALAQWAMHFTLRQNPAYPLAAIASVPPDLRARPTFNSYGFGGPLILAGIHPYIDGRTDMYGDAFTLDYVAALRGDGARFQALDRRWHFGWTILAPTDGLVQLLDASPDWRRIHSDRFGVVHVRVRPGPGQRL